MAFGNHTSDVRGYNGWCGVDNTFSYLGKNGKTWYHFLFKDPSFTSRFAERWDEAKDTLLQTALDTIDTQYKAVLGAQKRNFDRWDILNKKIGAGNVDHRTYNTFDLQVEYLREFINTRYNWIDENISEFRLQ
ncbi:MAG: CotH kinase family protein [Clostridia bacterium]|nr:CotH kinase family protein [Clostridia bacterium]